MPLNKVKPNSNMYGWISATWNPIRGRCQHDCVYCYMKDMPGTSKPVRLEQKELRTPLGSLATIFVGSGTDMWAEDIPDTWIQEVLEYCRQFKNEYLFQTKNPARFLKYWKAPEDIILGTTLETNRDIPEISKAPVPRERVKAMAQIGVTKMVSIEPIIDFDFYEMVGMIQLIRPNFVSIGADSKGHNLPEPSAAKIHQLIDALRPITQVIIKNNLGRLVTNGQ